MPVVQLLKSQLGEEVFVPTNWDGAKYADLDLTFLPGMPTRLKPPPRFINKRLYECAQVETERLLEYMYVRSKSPVASPLVVAPKATKPFIRLCGDYRTINKFLLAAHVPIPNVKHELEKIKNFKYTLDLDMVNAFHQRRLSEASRAMLSIQTPWGQIEPRFMPEGISVGSGELQTMVKDIFGDFEEWTIVLFDNVLLLAHSYEDAYNKLELFLKRCKEYNLFLKFSKSFLGFERVKFFGYVCDNKGWELDADRKQALLEVKMPTNRKGMQSFLGMVNFFRDHVPNISSELALLYDMTQESFCWDKDKWNEDYATVFEKAKHMCADSLKLYFPDYELPWILRTDASETGCGSVLLQEFTKEDGSKVMQPLAFTSHKFSGPATRWSTIEQECFGIFHAVKTLSYYLVGKSFVLETDHNNLLWMGASDVSKIQRWRIFLQSYSFLIRHIAGRDNVVADPLSRLLMLRDAVADDGSLYEFCHSCDSSDSESMAELLRAYLHDEILQDLDGDEEAALVALETILEEDGSLADPRLLAFHLDRLQEFRQGEEGQGAQAQPELQAVDFALTTPDFTPRPELREDTRVAVSVYDWQLDKFLIGSKMTGAPGSPREASSGSFPLACLNRESPSSQQRAGSCSTQPTWASRPTSSTEL